jgi:anti-anti-sigma regulatory factor
MITKDRETEVIALRRDLEELQVEQRRRQESLRFLQLIAKTYASLALNERSAICDTLLSLVATFLQARLGAVLVESFEGGPLVGVSAKEISSLEALTSDPALPLWRWVMEEKVARAVSSEEVRQRWSTAPPDLQGGFACVALDVMEQSVGLLLVAEKVTGLRWDELDLEFLSAAAGIGAMALIHAKTYSSLQKLLEDAAHHSEQKERAALEELDRQTEIIARQKSAIQELSTPILLLWDDVLALPMVGQIDAARAEQTTEALLKRIVDSGARCVIVDVTGVDLIDTTTAGHFVKMMEAAGLLGSYCVVTGVGPEIAKTMVALDLDFGRVKTLRNLKEGLKHCMKFLAKPGSDQGKASR